MLRAGPSWNARDAADPACSFHGTTASLECSKQTTQTQMTRQSPTNEHRAHRAQLTFSMSSFLLIVVHLFRRSLKRSSSFCCSSICLRRSQFAYREKSQTTSPSSATLRLKWTAVCYSPWADHLSFPLSSQGQDSYCSQVRRVSTASDPSEMTAGKRKANKTWRGYLKF